MISAAHLAARLGDADLRVVDATWFLPPSPTTGRESYRQAHIPGAVFFDIDAIADAASGLPHMLPSPEEFARAAGGLGLSREAEIVVYDAQGIFSAPRVWWTLKVMGYPRVRVLDGGLKAWMAAGFPLEGGEAAPAPAKVVPMFAGGVRDLRQVQAVLADGSAQVVDARPAARFRGEAPEPRPGLRSGHMPGARSLPWSTLVREDGTLRSEGELQEAFTAAGVDVAAPVVATCGSGVSAAVVALALARLGQDAALYDGSWSEWGASADTDVVTGP
ncbi:MAG: 3-mercaptopyruvate sulfurtransferase [Phenylobacterium sp.]